MDPTRRALRVTVSTGQGDTIEAGVRLHPDDDVAIAWRDLDAGTDLSMSADNAKPTRFQLLEDIPGGHKVAVRAIAAGRPVRRYGEVIGYAMRAIQPGEHVHVHNLGPGAGRSDEFCEAVPPPMSCLPDNERRTFLGYRRPGGRVGTRNYIAVISTVTCSAHVAHAIAHHFTLDRLSAYPNVDGVIALANSPACSMQPGGLSHKLYRRTLVGMARHPNVGATLFVGLGCELCQASELAEMCRRGRAEESPHIALNIQEVGGVGRTIAAGIEAVVKLLPHVNQAVRTPQPIAELVLALQCGGSDGWSGVTANPILGLLVDEVVRQGGTGVLSETPEIYGAEQLLTRRAADLDVRDKLLDKVQWWQEYTERMQSSIDNNPTPGNIRGGLTTIYEKSLGAVAKGGCTPLRAVYAYAEPITEWGLVFMDGPGYDPVSVTGQVAGGANLVLFTTGRGSVLGFRPAPVVKITSNSAVYRHMLDDMDFDAGELAQGRSAEELAAELLDLAISVASGRPSKSEAQGMGEAEFMPWSMEVL